MSYNICNCKIKIEIKLEHDTGNLKVHPLNTTFSNTVTGFSSWLLSWTSSPMEWNCFPKRWHDFLPLLIWWQLWVVIYHITSLWYVEVVGHCDLEKSLIIKCFDNLVGLQLAVIMSFSWKKTWVDCTISSNFYIW